MWRGLKVKKKFNQYVSSKAVFNDLSLYLKENNLLPSIVFTLSRKKCEMFAKQLNVILNTQEEQSEVMNIFESKVHKCFNYKDIIQMKQYQEIKQLVSKGIAFHHSGVYHIFKEIIEMLMAHKNKDGKVTKEDFKLLRKKGKKSESKEDKSKKSYANLLTDIANKKDSE